MSMHTDDEADSKGDGTDQMIAGPPIVDQQQWEAALAGLRPNSSRVYWQDSPEGWPQSPAGSKWAPSEAFARHAEPQRCEVTR
jgi:hypothetical protein